MSRLTLTLMLIVMAATQLAVAEENQLRTADFSEVMTPPAMKPHEVVGHVRVRSYPMAPPTIPHSTEGFVVTKDMNQCMLCHAAERAPAVRAPAIGVSHYQTRAGEYLSDISARRYFCTQCHVPQHQDSPPVANVFHESQNPR